MVELEIFRLFLIVLARFTGLMITAPFLGSASFPITARAGLTGMLALIVTPTLPALAQPLPAGGLEFATVAAGEMLIGMVLGFVMTLTFAAIQLAGQIMDMQTGFGMMNIFNPALEVQFPILGFFLFIMAVLFLLATDGHHMMIRGVINSYENIPVGELALRPAMLLEVSRWGRLIFLDGMMISAPVAGAMLLAYITMGFLGRVVPQIHLFVIGFPITMAAGLILTAMILGVYMQMLNGMFYRMFENVETVIRGMGPG